MRDEPSQNPAVVVGIDGSRTALSAALWAVEEAVSRDVPLRLLYAIEPPGEPADPTTAARALANADVALREIFVVVESMGTPVRIEAEIVQDRPEHALRAASRAAVLLCLGALGLGHAGGRRIGSVAATVARDAHCPVAIVRRHDPVRRGAGWVIAEVDESPDGDAVLACALREARLRRAPLRVLGIRRPDGDDDHGARGGCVLVRTHLDKRLARWRRAYPDVAVEAVAVSGSTTDYVAREAETIQLAVVGQARATGLADITGPAAHAALHDTACSVLICSRHGAL
ncbi:universal stress protein [Mycobacterium sp. PS03-16]|uniref:universal stress protein n=1 Tax=Mycobacterium sp. PS03-16 TaxID=2559611 RepID=UPI0010735AA7|nr:universal stress protein [Mycobacterium sp. PS03-16]TFV54861.1 universal stress protein [Mycobacterium sp. PS03-16]